MSVPGRLGIHLDPAAVLVHFKAGRMSEREGAESTAERDDQSGFHSEIVEHRSVSGPINHTLDKKFLILKHFAYLAFGA